MIGPMFARDESLVCKTLGRSSENVLIEHFFISHFSEARYYNDGAGHGFYKSETTQHHTNYNQGYRNYKQ